MTKRQTILKALRVPMALAAILFAAAGAQVHAQNLRFTEVARASDTQVRVTATGSSTSPVTLEGTADFANWIAVTTFAANTSPMTYTDTTTTRRFYRLRSGAATPAPTQLTDLATYPNRVFPAPEGFDTIQYAADGKLGFIVWKDQTLIYRERNTADSWTETTVNNSGRIYTPITGMNFYGPREEYRFQPSAGLAFDSNSRPHVFMASGRNVLHFTQNGTTWTQSESIPNTQANGDIEVLEVSAGPNNVFHLGALTVGPSRNLTHASSSSGWNWTKISDVTDAPPTYWAPPFAPRWLSMAVDSGNAAHFAFRSSMDITYHPQGYPRAYSVLKYASNKSGAWAQRVIQTPTDTSAEAANGASITIAPDGRPRIASWYDERAETGSAQESRLYLHQMDASGNWSSSVVLTAPDGYVAGDGPKGTGFSPYLRYDSRGRAHILFLDHAGEHFELVGQQEYAGNVRHAWWNGSSWSVETVFRQNNVLAQEAVYPAFALSPNSGEMAVTVLQRDTNWRLTPFPPIAASTYYFRFFTKTLP